MTLNEAVKGDMVATSDTVTAPVAQIWTGADYDIYYYLDYAYDEEWNEYTDGCWASGANEYATAKISAGAGVWFRDDNEDVLITFAGQVVDAGTTPKTLVANKYNLIANPYPMQLLVNNSEQVTWDEIVATGDTVTAPVLQVWNVSDYDIYYYMDYAYDSEWNEYTDGCWASGANEYLETPIEVGCGFWVKPTTEVTVTFVK